MGAAPFRQLPYESLSEYPCGYIPVIAPHPGRLRAPVKEQQRQLFQDVISLLLQKNLREPFRPGKIAAGIRAGLIIENRGDSLPEELSQTAEICLMGQTDEPLRHLGIQIVHDASVALAQRGGMYGAYGINHEGHPVPGLRLHTEPPVLTGVIRRKPAAGEINLRLRPIRRISSRQDALHPAPSHESLFPALIAECPIRPPSAHGDAQGTVLCLCRNPSPGIPAGPVELIVEMNPIALFPGILRHLFESLEIMFCQILPPVHPIAWMRHGLPDSLAGHLVHLRRVHLPVHLSVQKPERGLGAVLRRMEKSSPEFCRLLILIHISSLPA